MTATEMVEVVASALYLSVVSFPGELHPPLSELPKRRQDKYHRHARAVLAALTEAGEVEWGVENGHTPIDHVTDAPDQTFAALRCRARQGRGVPARVVSRLTLPWESAE